MYNNRRNNRFSIFIAAIIVSLLVLLTGCASTKKETDLAKPVAEDSSNPVTLTVYLTAHYANPDTHCPIYEKLLDYQKENPNITIQFVSPKEYDEWSFSRSYRCNGFKRIHSREFLYASFRCWKTKRKTVYFTFVLFSSSSDKCRKRSERQRI